MAERFSREALEVLTEAGWQPGRSQAEATAAAVRQVGAVVGHRGAQHHPSEPAIAALTEFGGLTLDPTNVGQQITPRPFAFDPTLVDATAETMADVGAVLGVALFPLGTEGDRDAVLAMDDRGRVFSIDHTGEWFLGDTIETAIETLVHGWAPARVRDDGTWT